MRLPVEVTARDDERRPALRTRLRRDSKEADEQNTRGQGLLSHLVSLETPNPSTKLCRRGDQSRIGLEGCTDQYQKF